MSLLKRKVGSRVVVQTILPMTGEEGQFLVQPVAILQRQLVKKGNVAAMKVLIQWSNLPPKDATWEDYSYINSKFRHLTPILEVKDCLKQWGML